jgi:uncharacterized phage protein gp47/JayE
MPIDVSDYVDMTPLDLDAQTLVELAVADARAGKWPEWQADEEFDPGVVMLEAWALVVDQAIFRINRLPAVVIEGLLRLLGLERDLGAPARGRVRVYAGDTAGHTIPAGTRFLLELDDEDAVELVTDTALAIAVGQATGDVNVTVAGTPSTSSQGVTAGTELIVLDAVPYLDRVTLLDPLTGARDPETSAAFLSRGRNVLASMTTTLVKPSHFRLRALAQPYVSKALVYDKWNPASGNPAGDDLGDVTIVAAGPGAAPLSSSDKADLLAILDTQAEGSIIPHIADAHVTTVDVLVKVIPDGTVPDAELAANVEAAIRGYLDPVPWPFLPNVYGNELVALIDNVPGVHLERVLEPVGDVPLDGPGPLALAGDVTVQIVDTFA